MKLGISQEFEIMQNSILGSWALAAFVNGFYSKALNQENRVTMWHIITVLPMVFHKVSRMAILKRRGFRAILERDVDSNIAQNEVILNLDKRMFDLYKRTFRSMNFAFYQDLLAMENGLIIAHKKYKIPSKAYGENKDILKAAEKLGGWAGGISVFEYFTVLGVSPNDARYPKDNYLARR